MQGFFVFWKIFINMKRFIKKILKEELNEFESLWKYITNDELIKHEKMVAIDGFGHEGEGQHYSDVVWLDTKLIKVNKSLHGDHFDKKEFEFAIDFIRYGEELPPILVDSDYTILDGYNRFKAAKLAMIKKIPAIIHIRTKKKI